MAQLGILDWGIGGLGFYRLLKAKRPQWPVVYGSDAGATPYGKMTPDALAARVAQMAWAMRQRGVTHLVIACNAASTALPALGVVETDGELATPAGPLRVTGVIAHGIAQALRSRARVLGVIGGRRTITAGFYRRALKSAGHHVIQRVAQPLSGLIEDGVLDGPVLRGHLRRIVGPLRRVDALVLACTHYPAIAPRVAEALPGIEVLDPAEEMLRFVLRRWRGMNAAASSSAAHDRTDSFFTTGDRRSMRRAAWAAFGVHLARIQRMDLASRNS